MRRTDKCRFRWTLKASEINFNMHVEGKHICNHLPRSNFLTDKFKFFDALKKLEKSMALGHIQSSIFRSPNEFMLLTFSLCKNTQLTNFLALPNIGMWVLKNTSMEKDQGISLIDDIENYKKSMLLKVRRGPREVLQAIVGTNKGKISDFSDSDEEIKTSPAHRGTKSPSKSMSPKKRPQAKNQKRRKKIAVFERMIV